PLQRIPSAWLRAREARRGVRARCLPALGRGRPPRHASLSQARHQRRGRRAAVLSSSLRTRARSALASLERLAERPLGAVVLFAAALAVYGVRAIGWPLIAGRDLDEYLYGYIQFLDWHPLLPWSMLFRTPVTPIVAGSRSPCSPCCSPGRSSRGPQRLVRSEQGLLCSSRSRSSCIQPTASCSTSSRASRSSLRRLHSGPGSSREPQAGPRLAVSLSLASASRY